MNTRTASFLPRLVQFLLLLLAGALLARAADSPTGSNVAPSLAQDNAGNRALSDSELRSNIHFKHALEFQFANLQNISIGELGFRMGDTSVKHVGVQLGMMSVTGARPSFAATVCGVIGLSAEKQMRRIYAIRDIAMVTNTKAVSNRTFCNLPRNTVGFYQFAMKRKNAVTATLSSVPNPTAVGLCDLLPKSSENLCGKTLSDEGGVRDCLCSVLHKYPVHFVSAFQRDNAAMHAQFQTVSA